MVVRPMSAPPGRSVLYVRWSRGFFNLIGARFRHHDQKAAHSPEVEIVWIPIKQFKAQFNVFISSEFAVQNELIDSVGFVFKGVFHLLDNSYWTHQLTSLDKTWKPVLSQICVISSGRAKK